jgi:hypothetical protein
MIPAVSTHKLVAKAAKHKNQTCSKPSLVIGVVMHISKESFLALGFTNSQVDEIIDEVNATEQSDTYVKVTGDSDQTSAQVSVIAYYLKHWGISNA